HGARRGIHLVDLAVAIRAHPEAAVGPGQSRAVVGRGGDRREGPRRRRDGRVHGKLACLKGASPMIASIVTFRLPEPMSVDQAAEVFRSTAPRYLGMPGLVRKHYYVSEAGDRV